MENTRLNLEMVICNIILSMERPFSVSQLINEMSSQGITNNELVLDLLGQLCESGVIKYSEIDDDIWAYKKICVSA